MALIKNESGEWAWVDDASESPKKYYSTKDEALEASRTAGGAGAPAQTKDTAAKVLTYEGSGFVD